MENKIYLPLPNKALGMIQEMANEEMNGMIFYAYLAQCTLSRGYENASQFFWKEAQSEFSHQKKWQEYVQGRGKELEIEAIPKPEFEFTDLRSAISAACEKEVALAEKYDDFCREMMKVDTMTYQEGMEFLNIQKYSMAEMSKIWAVFGDLKEIEDQKEMDINYWGPKNETIPG